MKFYAVRVGRYGPKVYESWKETDQAVRGFPHAQHKSFPNKLEAEDWINTFLLQPQIKFTENQIIKRLHSQYNREQHFKNQNEKKVDDQVNEDEDEDERPKKRHQISVETGEKKCLILNLAKKEEFSTPNDSNVKPSSSSSRAKDFTPQNLSPDQAMVFNRVLNGRSVFFTGSAGTGKSHLLKSIIRHLKDESKKQVYVTASTGIAASLIKGTTLHSFVGLGLANDPVEVLMKKLKNSVSARKRWISAHTLIIDEVSMIDGNFFDKLNELAKLIRKTALPFGGIQLILTGDFFQLPPVTKQGYPRVPYIFETRTWQECISKKDVLVLKHVYRQSDQTFVDILNEIRYGQVSQNTIKVMESLSRDVHYSDGIQPAELYPTQYEVKRANQLHLNELSSPDVLFTSRDIRGEKSSLEDAELHGLLDKNTLISRHLTVKVGAQVMLVKNLPDDGLVNGSIGIITAFIDASKAGQSTIDFDEDLHELDQYENDSKGWPKVLFTNGKTKILRPHSFDVEDPSGKVLASRYQVPLILAWALSIHKSQGQSLDRVKIDLTKSFESGQVYVALSRATSLNSIQVLGFQKKKVTAHPVVLEWAKKFL